MSIADKLVYLDETKTKLRDAINIALAARGEAPLDSNDTFRSYAERLFYPGFLFGQGEQGTYSLPPNANSYFTDTAGTTAAVVTDAIARVNDESGNGVNWSQATAGSRPVWAEESGFNYLSFDLLDDALTTALPAGTYTVVLPTRQGIWFDSVTHAGGTFSIGPTSYTGGPAGILTALESDGVAKLVAMPLIIDRALTAGEKAALVQWYQARGAGPELELGPELLTNGTFDVDISGWSINFATGSAAISWDPSEQLRFDRLGFGFNGFRQFGVIPADGIYLAYSDYDNDAVAKSLRFAFACDTNLAGVIPTDDTGTARAAYKLTGVVAPAYFGVYSASNANAGTCFFDNISLRRIQPVGGGA